MKAKFIKAMLEVCETPKEIDEVFGLFPEFNLLSKRNELLKEEGCKYFDLPMSDEEQYSMLKTMYTNSNTIVHRKLAKAKAVINEYL